MVDELKIKQNTFNDLFTVHYIEMPDTRVFMHFQIQDNEIFYNSLYDYFFSNDNLIKYIKNKKGISFNPTLTQKIELYQHLQNYIDSENIQIDITNYNEHIIAIIKDECETEEENSKIFARKDKFGKIGEYIFCNILSNYYNFNCIIPKVHYITDNNMNVYGIDALFYSEQDNLLLFGESKFCKNLGNGISLINESLKNYQLQIQEEYRIILSGQILKNCSSVFNEKFGDARDSSYTVEEFISKAGITKIGIPIFIAHGQEIDKNSIIKRLSNISQSTFFDLETIYYFISLPVINKDNLMKCFKTKINEKLSEYKHVG